MCAVASGSRGDESGRPAPHGGGHGVPRFPRRPGGPGVFVDRRRRGSAWEPESGFADPSDCFASLLAGVRGGGGRVLVEMGPVRRRVSGDRVTGVRAGSEEISAPRVVVAAGAGTRAPAARVGIDLPVFPLPIGAGLLRRRVPSGSVMPGCEDRTPSASGGALQRQATLLPPPRKSWWPGPPAAATASSSARRLMERR